MGLFVTVGGLGHPDLQFDGRKNYSGCRLCGAVFQTQLDRADNPTLFQQAHADSLRQRWRERHAKTHTAAEHEALRASGMLCTPEAAYELARHNIAPVTDLVQSEEHAQAAAEAPRAPAADAEGS